MEPLEQISRLCGISSVFFFLNEMHSSSYILKNMYFKNNKKASCTYTAGLVYVYLRTHIRLMYVCLRPRMHTACDAPPHACMYVCISVCTDIYKYEMCVCMSVMHLRRCSRHIRTYVYVCTYVCMYVCIYVYTYVRTYVRMYVRYVRMYAHL